MQTRFNRRFLLLALLLALSCGIAVAQVTEFSAPVIGISDGDTIRVLHEGISKRIRLFGIDCPEMGQAFGSTAKKFTGDLAFGKTVKIRVRDIDRYHRIVAEITLPDGKMLNHELVKAGLAWWYRRYARSDSELHRLETEAKEGKRGLWADADPVPPWTWRKEKAAAHAVRSFQ
jgi:micrococcal nuclease